MVQPAPQPFSVVATASTSGWSGSGVTPVSGVSGIVGQYAGPHYVEEQSLNISYVRVPFGTVLGNGISLTDASANYRIQETKLACIITANYSRKKVDAVFDTSSYQQSQKFQFLGVSSDANGNSYGSIDASTLGPVGDIVTTQPWYYRRPWVDTQDTEVVSSVTVCNFGLGFSGYGDFISRNQNNYSRTYIRYFIPPSERFSHAGANTAFAYDGILSDAYRLPGAYRTEQESLVRIINFIDNVSMRLTSETLYAIPATVSQHHSRRFETDAGLPFYQSFRHDYS